MKNNDQASSINLEIYIDDDIDAIEADDITRNLDKELADLPYVTHLDRAAMKQNERGPLRSKSGELITAAGLVMQVLPAAIPNLIDFLKGWSLRPGNKQLKIRAEGNSGSLDIEFNPDTLSVDRVTQLAKDLQGLVK